MKKPKGQVVIPTVSAEQAGAYLREFIQSGKREQLHALTDKLNDAICSAERAIQGLQLGVAARVVMSSEPGMNRVLAFQKEANEWHLLIIDVTPHTETRLPLVRAPREVRLQAVPFLPSLVVAMKDAAKREWERVEAARETLAKFIKDVEGK